MLTRLDLRGVGDVASRLPRPVTSSDLPVDEVRSIVEAVRSGGDSALRDLTARLDGVELGSIRVPPEELAAALAAVPLGLREALEASAGAVRDYHLHQLVAPPPYERRGLVVTDVREPVARAGLYVPGGRARYPSTVVMTAVPAQVAGVGEVALCVPPGPSGEIATETLAAAAVVGVKEVYRLGGAQAVAALAYGTESVRPVDLIAGPGNLYVSLAQREVAGVVGVPSAFAGPSEVVVVADETAPPELAAIDLVVQAEHGPFGLAWLVTWSEKVADLVASETARVARASARREAIESTLSRGGRAVLVDGPVQAMAVANAVAPEHLELMVHDPSSLVPLVRNAGAVFLGVHSPASVGDYMAGPSHVLPTDRAARFSSGLGVDDFLKRIHVISLDERALAEVAPHLAAIADAEGLLSHAESVRTRVTP